MGKRQHTPELGLEVAHVVGRGLAVLGFLLAVRAAVHEADQIAILRLAKVLGQVGRVLVLRRLRAIATLQMVVASLW